jgi:SPP1 family predicted phage head-tail adaptor
MNINELRHRIDIQSHVVSQSPAGFRSDAWTTVQTVWGKIQPKGGNERMLAKQVQAESTHTITIRYFAGLTTYNRLQYDGRTFNITNINNLEERNFVQVLDCFELAEKAAE